MDDSLKSLYQDILDRITKLQPLVDGGRSPEINIIMQALSKAQGEYKPLIANEEGSGGMFANLEAILSSVREALAKNGLAFYQTIDVLDHGEGASLLRTILGHASGQFISSLARIVPTTTNREMGRLL